jgi:carboxylesterase type B
VPGPRRNRLAVGVTGLREIRPMGLQVRGDFQVHWPRFAHHKGSEDVSQFSRMGCAGGSAPWKTVRVLVFKGRSDGAVRICDSQGAPRALAAKVSDAWINFARRGDPNHSGLPQWPSFTADQCPTMIFDTECVMKNNPDTAERKVLTET